VATHSVYAFGVALDDLDDGALARRVAAAGASPDAQAEGELYRRLARRARLYGLRHLRDEQAAADLAQQVLLTTLERLRAGEVREPDRIASFVLGMCRMTVLEMRRGTRRREALLENWIPASAGMTVLEHGAIHSALNTSVRTAIALRVAQRPANEHGAPPWN